MVKIFRKLHCLLKGHLYLEWSHDPSLKRELFFKGTVILKNPYCIRCGKVKINVRTLLTPEMDKVLREKKQKEEEILEAVYLDKLQEPY